MESNETNHGWVVLFPGQGSQYAGMAKALIDHFPWTRQLYEEASDAIHLDLLKLCLEGPNDALQLTANCQPSILTTAFAWFQVLARNLDFRPAVGAGHSLGEWTALLASRALTLSEATRMVRTRGELMQSAVPPDQGKMAAVIGLDDDKVQELCNLATEGPHSLVVPANYNAPAQVVIAGHAAAVDRVEAVPDLHHRPELKPRKLIPLKVSAPFHCPLMTPVAEKFEPHLRSVAWKPLSFPVVFNVDAQWRDSADPIPLLRNQIDHPVRWTASVQEITRRGLSRFVEMGPGKVLSGLVKRSAGSATLFSVESLDEFQKFEKIWKESGK
jgi:[acyl-carrier-protein] S-malonyltransferase